MKNVKSVSRTHRLPSLMLRLGLAFVFLYAGAESLLHPLEWIGYLPNFVTKLVQPQPTLRLLAIFEIALALWLLSGRYKRYSAALAALTFAGIVVASLNDFLITFRDVGLLFAALALVFIED